VNTIYKPPFNLEIYELGGWHSIDVVQELEDALYVASSFCNSLEGLPEEKVGLIDNNNKII
jgi:hypothetical protein